MKLIVSLLSVWFGISMFDDHSNIKQVMSNPSYFRIAVMRWKQDYNLTMRQASYELSSISRALELDHIFKRSHRAPARSMFGGSIQNIPSTMNSVRRGLH